MRVDPLGVSVLDYHFKLCLFHQKRRHMKEKKQHDNMDKHDFLNIHTRSYTLLCDYL